MSELIKGPSGATLRSPGGAPRRFFASVAPLALLGGLLLSGCGSEAAPPNACGGHVPLSAEPGQACGVCGGGSFVCEGVDALSCQGANPPNGCGGCATLADLPGQSCGLCGDGAWVCEGSDRVQCQGARSPNECGGCATLAAAVGSACEGCGTAVWGCESSEAVACLASSPPNACGGCAALEGNPGDPCGACPGGALGCALDGESVFCEAEQALNACGGCAALPAGEGDPCGPCGLDTFVCAGPDALSCSGSTQCLDGAACTVDAECVDRRCSFGRCAPLGWAFVPAATFVMGAPLGEPGFHPARENGQHTVILTHPILVKETTVTQGEWFELLGTRPSYFDACGDECPVERVNWYEMLQYADALSIRDGLTPCYGLTGCVGALGQGCGVGVDRCGGYSCDPPIDVDLGCPGYRLPTEAEWEYFARAGTTSAFITASGTLGSWPALPPDPELDAIAWFGGNSQVSYAGAMDCSWIDPSLPSCGTNPVGMKAPNAWGLFDITGNVWERVWDWSGDYPAPGTTVTDPLGPMFGTERRMRGGPFDAWGQYMRVAYRTGPVPTARFYNIGFRLVRSLSLP